MAKAGQLIKGIASAYRLPESKIALSGRMIRERGMLTSGAHGVNAPDMTFLDAARLMLGYLVLDKPSLIADAVRVFGSFPVSSRPDPLNEGDLFTNVENGESVLFPEDVSQPALNFLDNLCPNTFEMALARILEELADPEKREFYRCTGIHVSVNSHGGQCFIDLPGWSHAWCYSAEAAQNMAMLASGIPTGLDPHLDSVAATETRRLSLTNLVGELLQSYPAIQIDRSIGFEVLAAVAELFSSGSTVEVRDDAD